MDSAKEEKAVVIPIVQATTEVVEVVEINPLSYQWEEELMRTIRAISD